MAKFEEVIKDYPKLLPSDYPLFATSSVFYSSDVDIVSDSGLSIKVFDSCSYEFTFINSSISFSYFSFSQRKSDCYY